MDYLLNISNNKKKIFFYVIGTEIYIILSFLINPILSLLPFVFILCIVALYYFMLKGPVIWIMIMVFATGLDIWGQIIGGITLFHVGWLFSILTTIIYLLTKNDVKLKYSFPITKPFIILILLLSFSLIYSPNFSSGLHIILQTIALYVFFIIISNFITSKNQFITILLILLFINVFQTLLLTHQLLFENVTYFAASTIESEEGFRIYRPSGSFDDPNVLATYMIFGMLYTFSFLLFIKTKKIFKIFLGFALLISIIGIILTFSRSGWLSLIFGIITILFYSHNKKIIFQGLLIISLLLISAVIFTPYGSLIIDRFTSIFDIMKDPSIRVRIALIKSSFAMFLDNPLFGIGFRGYPILYDFYLDPIVPQVQLYVKEPHTLWSTLLAELGLWGVIAVAYFFIQFFKENIKILKLKMDDFARSIFVGTMAVFIAMNIDFLFYGFLFPHFNLFWLNFALFYAIKENYVKFEN